MTTRRPLTIALLFATPGTSWGGMERHTLDLAEELSIRGHSVHVMAHPEYQTRFSGNVHFHHLPVQRSRLNPLLWLSLRRCVRSVQPDVLHAHGSKAARLAQQMSLRSTLLRVGTVHGIKKQHRGFEHLDAVIAVSPAIHQSLTHSNKKLIYNGISMVPARQKNPATESRETPVASSAPPHCIAVGRLEPVKGFHALIEAWSQIKKPATLTIYGEGSERHRLAHLIEKLELRDRVKLAGYQPDLQSAYDRADLTVISSEREGFSYVLLEALTAHCPVVSTPVAGPLELLPKTALSRGTDALALRDLLNKTLDDLSALRTQQIPAMQRVRNHFSIATMVDHIEQLYYRVLT